ncbi:hypothetical protein [Haloarcula nitratireducens]|uniref:Uncharacterized protein n=1 Tax=Haloarcula nitratireducens TaxID=2487749 RepID=A0AAW4PIY6_9EURY|nr:hypothetical protein [Halomicroarcula nitratireducens]MBX0297749.1 hypothetical protein [Halomicroarcula nitratireducens]
MSERELTDETRDETPTEKFYLPAVAFTPTFDCIENFVEDAFDFHGVVLIPESYNK